MPVLLALALILFTGTAHAQPADSSAFRVYAADGSAASFDALVAAMGDADVVFFGEEHDDPVAHALELRLLRAADSLAASQDRPAVLSLEMFERDVQLVLDEYLGGLVRERDFLAAARPWANYVSDYRPLVEYALAHELPVVATNAPQRYVSRVGRGESLDALAAPARAMLPRTVAPASDSLVAAFSRMVRAMMGGTHGMEPPDSTETASSDTASASVHGGAMGFDNLLAAQNLRDATMARSLADALDAYPGVLVLHVNGTFHSEGGLGVPEHLARYAPEARVLVVTAKPDAAFPALAPSAVRTNGGFVVVTDPAAQE